MNHNRLIDYLIAEHHKHCCDCATVKEAMQRDSVAALMYEYAILFGDHTQEETRRLRDGDLGAVCEDIAKKRGHTL